MAKRNNGSSQPEEVTTQQTTPTQTSGNIPEYLAAALKIPASTPLGARTADEDIVGSFSNVRPVAGIMVLDYVPTLGVSKDATSAINRAAYYDFNKIRSKISGNRPYQPSDHMIYRVAIDSLREMYAYAARIYCTVAEYAATNLYRPRHILNAMGLIAESWIGNAAALYQWLRTHSGALAPFPTVPIGKISERRKAFNSAFFTDGDLSRAQTYIINQKYFWSYEVVDEVKGLTARKFPQTYEDFVELWDRMYVAFQNSSDAYIIAADIRRAFEDQAITTLECPAVDGVVPYVKMDPVLTSIMNASIVAPASSNMDAFIRTFRISDEVGVIKCEPSLSEAGVDNVGRWLPANISHLNMVQADPTPSDFLVALRLHPQVRVEVSFDNPNTSRVYVDAMGTEVIVGARIVQMRDGLYADNISFASAHLVGPGTTTRTDLIRFVSLLSQFDWHPPVYLQEVTSDGEAVTNGNGFIEDIQNYIPVSSEQVTNIHENTLLAEFGMPD